MALTIVVRAGDAAPSVPMGPLAGPIAGAGRTDPGEEGGPVELALTLDAPRVVIGRGEGCEVRLPDPSVNHRHASIRQKGGEYVVVDEGSLNGTFLGEVRLPPQTPRAIRSGELVRVGRVWLEVRVEPALVKGSTAAAAREVALTLVMRGLARQGEEPRPRVEVVEGPDRGKALLLGEAGRAYVLGRGKDADLALDDGDASRRHVSVMRKGDTLLVQDLGSKGGTSLDGAELGPGETVWRAGQTLAFGATACTFVYPAVEALAELERSPVEKMRGGEAPPSPSSVAAAAPAPPAPGTPAPAEPVSWDTPGPAPVQGQAGKGLLRKSADKGGWGFTDGAVVLLALGVLVLSVLGFFWLFRR